MESKLLYSVLKCLQKCLMGALSLALCPLEQSFISYVFVWHLAQRCPSVLDLSSCYNHTYKLKNSQMTSWQCNYFS